MTPEFVHGIIARSNRNLLLRCLLGIALLVGAGLIFSNYLYNFTTGPFTVKGKLLGNAASLGDLSQRFITVTGDDDLIDTGYQYVTTSSSGAETIEAYYQALILDDKFLLVKSDKLLEGKTVTGGLTEMPGDVREEVIRDIEKEYPDLKDTFLPFMLDTSDFRIPGYIGLAIAAVVLLLTVWGVFRWISRRGDPLQHPIMKSLSRFGDPDTIASQIEMDMVNNPAKVGKLSLGRSWLVQSTGSSLSATRFNDVMWAYKSITQHRTNGIPTGKTYAALIWDRHGTCMTVNGKEKLIDETLTELSRRSAGAVFGFSADIQNMWKSNRADFLTAVDQRRQDSKA